MYGLYEFSANMWNTEEDISAKKCKLLSNKIWKKSRNKTVQQMKKLAQQV